MGTVLRNSECRVLEFRVNNSFKVTQFICRIETETACWGFKITQFSIIERSKNVIFHFPSRHQWLISFFIGIQNVTVNASSSRVNVTGKIVLSCYVIGGPTDLNITWYKASQVIGLTQRTKVETEFRHSTLTIRDVLAEDEGNYICSAAWVLYFSGRGDWRGMGKG